MTQNYPNIIGLGGTTADAYNKQYPGVPYGPGDFNHQCAITNYQNSTNLSDTEL